MTATAERAELMDLFAKHRALGHAPPAEHAWLIAHGVRHRFPEGHVFTPKGKQTSEFSIVFAGRIVIRMDRGAGSHKIFEWKAGDIGGLMPYSRGASPPSDAVVEEPLDVLLISKEHFPEMIRECPVVTATCVHAIIDRAREFRASDLRDDKLLSLGRLASGLAHELNNPASAVVRSAKLLGETIDESETAAKRLHSAHLSEEQLAAVDHVRTACVSAAAGASATETAEHLSPLARADREDALAEWLAARGADVACAGPLSETGVPLASLDALAAKMSGDALNAALHWIAAGCRVRALSSEIEMASSRIHEIVGAVKGFSYMDHAPTAEPVDVSRGLADTLTVLAAKIRGKSVHVEVELAPDMPRAHGVGAELNQVWMNLIDNALDAVPQGGHVAITAGRALDRVIVRITDDGPGIPAEIKERIFDPFFTTKGIGQGTGLGLDIVRRLVQRHEGDVSVESAPGRTEFTVRIPAA